jgi:hypothetical protein
MLRSIFIILVIMLSVSAMANGPLPEHPWGFADIMVSYRAGSSQYDQYPDPKPFHNLDLALGAPHGISASEADNSDVVTLGDRGRIVLQFNNPVKDDPDNPGGYDFIVFSNCIWVGGNPYLRWQELAYVEISNDGNEWFLIPPDKPVSKLVGASTINDTPEKRDTGHSYTLVRNYAEYTPTLGLPMEVTRAPEEFYCIPDRQSVADNDELIRIDAVSGGGDAFDIAEAVKQVRSGEPLLDESGKMVPAGIHEFKYIRIWDALSGDWQVDVLEVSAEIDAVADVRPAETLGKAKQRGDGEFTVIRDAVVTAVITDPFYTQRQEIFIQAEDRSSAIRLVRSLEPIITYDEFGEPNIHTVEPFPVNAGDLVSVTGHLSTLAGERVIADPLVTKLDSSRTVSPLGMNARTALANPARFVKTWGQVKENGFNYFIIDGGSADIKVWSDMLMQPGFGDHVSVTGVMGPVDGEMGLRVLRQEDIVTY